VTRPAILKSARERMRKDGDPYQGNGNPYGELVPLEVSGHCPGEEVITSNAPVESISEQGQPHGHRDRSDNQEGGHPFIIVVALAAPRPGSRHLLRQNLACELPARGVRSRLWFTKCLLSAKAKLVRAEGIKVDGYYRGTA
jgi:hypothetical protein